MTVRILQGDCREVLKALPEASVHCCVTSPPYFALRDYGVDGQIGLEESPDAFVEQMVFVFREVRRVLRDDGTAWINLGDSYSQNGGPGWQGNNGQRADRRFTMVRDTVPMRDAGRRLHAGLKPKDMIGIPWRVAGRRLHAGLKPKDMIGIPWRVAFALQADGWYLRQDIIWHKPNPMPESVRDRCTKAHEYILLLAKSERYYFDAEGISEAVTEATMNDRVDTGRFRPDRGYPGAPSAGGGRLGDKPTRNKRSVWTVTTKPFTEAHFATFPPDLIEPCILAGCPSVGTVLDPFGGAGTTGLVADRHGRNAILIELNPEYAAMAQRRISQDAPMFSDVQVSGAPLP